MLPELTTALPKRVFWGVLRIRRVRKSQCRPTHGTSFLPEGRHRTTRDPAVGIGNVSHSEGHTQFSWTSYNEKPWSAEEQPLIFLLRWNPSAGHSGDGRSQFRLETGYGPRTRGGASLPVVGCRRTRGNASLSDLGGQRGRPAKATGQHHQLKLTSYRPWPAGNGWGHIYPP